MWKVKFEYFCGDRPAAVWLDSQMSLENCLFSARNRAIASQIAEYMVRVFSPEGAEKVFLKSEVEAIE